MGYHYVSMVALPLLIAFSFLCIDDASATELTFEMGEHSSQCFFESVPLGDVATLEYQVIYGGKLDIDVDIKGPQGQVLYKNKRQQFGAFRFTSDESGDYQVCFSNEFSTITHKTLYFDFFLNSNEKPLTNAIGELTTAMTLLQSSVVTIHSYMSKVIDFQTHHRILESIGRSSAEDLNNTVQLWSIVEAFLLITTAIAEVYLLRRLFNNSGSQVKV